MKLLCFVEGNVSVLGTVATGSAAALYGYAVGARLDPYSLVTAIACFALGFSAIATFVTTRPAE